ncbi:GumC family protein [Prosthecomicrobium pneumaticum]|uniref:Uncharacterized protein involved in exopolysaccharide biosynthesis/Mrp family chromosome partitioning ATPase n=1 Tax=Prosthecomicrobium pneumaticum TaxID=81895 RepID=A0A7W9FQ30_9HYPH|nr:exopolysaccharide transport family protein [Prosthecomicrobium pneumaticum]MBB5754782.1 uncharacterized protein involved in exopolysaccharide biosynthesis/Mrp family chromosome partitioning ATPase [Prosthecomicrobium pneumaticum]
MGALLRALWRALPVLLVLALLVAAATYFGLGLIEPRYKATAKLLIENREPAVLRSQPAGEDERALLDREGVASQVQLIGSRDLARSVARRAGLERIAEFDPVRTASPVERLLVDLGLKAAPAAEPIEERVLERFAERLDVYPVDQTRVIVIDFSSADPDLAARVANLVADEYLQFDRATKRADNADAARWLEGQIDRLRGKVKEAEAKAEAYRSRRGLLETGGENAGTVAQQQLAALTAELARVSAARAAAEAQASTIREGLASGAALDSLDVSNAPLIQRLREQQAALRAEAAQLSATLLPGHPRMRAVEAQIESLSGQTRQEAERVLRGLEGAATLARAREEEVGRDLGRAKAAAAQAGDSGVELRAIEREAAAQRDLLETYLRRYREAVSRKEGEDLPADARIISRAAPPLQAAFPRRTPITAAVTVAFLMLALAVVLLRELGSGRPLRRTPVLEDVPPVPDAVPVDARVRWPEDDRVRRMMPADPSYAALLPPRAEESLAGIAARIREKDARRILVETVDGEGTRPLGGVALARCLAARGERTVLVELHEDGADGRAMMSSELLPGFAELYLNEASFAQVIFRDRLSRAHIIPLGRRPLAEDAIGSERFATLIEALDLTYDRVVIDLDPRRMTGAAEKAGAVLVVSGGGADPRAARAVEAATAAGIPLVLVLAVEPGGTTDPASVAA